MAAHKDRYFNIAIKLIPTGEVFPLKKVHNDMKISELKHLAEYSTGIPQHLQRLCYLDEGDLLDHTDVRHNDIVAAGLLQMNVWSVWRTLVEAAATNDVDYVFRLGVTKDTNFKTPNSEYMGPQAKQAWIAERAFTALYIAAHRGFLKLAQKLIMAGANVNDSTSLGQTPLHVAAANGHGTVVDLLLEKGADIDAVDQFGDSALAVASRFGHKGCERHLFLFRWQQRAKKIQPRVDHEMFAHQYFDSAFPVWLKDTTEGKVKPRVSAGKSSKKVVSGEHAQVYFTQILPPGEFEGTSMMAPRRLESPTGSCTPDSEASHDVTQDVDGLGENRTLQHSVGMTPIKEEESYGDSGGSTSRSAEEVKRRQHQRWQGRRGKKTGEKTESFDEWLSRKKAVEQMKIDTHKRQEQARKVAEEDRKRQEEYQDKSYEQWLAEKETTKRHPRPPPGTSKPPPGGLGGSPGAAVGTEPAAATDTATIVKPKRTKQPQTANDIIKSIIKRKEEEGEPMGDTPIDFWYAERDNDLMEQIRLGRTPLQKRLQQRVL